jgi:hypothetical protein
MRYSDSFADATSTTGNVTYVSNNGSKFYAFTSTGSITF